MAPPSCALPKILSLKTESSSFPALPVGGCCLSSSFMLESRRGKELKATGRSGEGQSTARNGFNAHESPASVATAKYPGDHGGAGPGRQSRAKPCPAQPSPSRFQNNTHNTQPPSRSRLEWAALPRTNTLMHPNVQNTPKHHHRKR